MDESYEQVLKSFDFNLLSNEVPTYEPTDTQPSVAFTAGLVLSPAVGKLIHRIRMAKYRKYGFDMSQIED